MRFPAHIDSAGLLFLNVPLNVQEWLKKRPDQQIEVDLRDEAGVRSSRQNRYFHGCVCPHVAGLWRLDGLIFSYQGRPLPEWPVWAVKDVLVATFGAPWVETPLGKARQSTADMTVAEFSDLIDKINDYCTHKPGAHEPLPSPEDWQGGHP